MSKGVIIGVLLCVLAGGSAFGANVGGANLPQTLDADGTQLLLNGAGLRKKMFIKVYAGALYLQNKRNDAEGIIAADEAMLVRMHFIYDGVSSKKLISAWNDGFKLATDGNTDSIQSDIDRFNSLFVQEAKKNHVYDFQYQPGKGTKIVMNGSLKAVIPGLEFKKALFGIWLKENTSLPKLRKAMLGK